jgi:hypothetical protein
MPSSWIYASVVSTGTLDEALSTIHPSGCGNGRKEEWLVHQILAGVIYTSGFVRPQIRSVLLTHCCSRARAWPIWRERWVCPSLVPGSYKFEGRLGGRFVGVAARPIILCGHQQIHWS